MQIKSVKEMGELFNGDAGSARTPINTSLKEHVLFLLSTYPLPPTPLLDGLRSRFPSSTFTELGLNNHDELKLPSPELQEELEKTTILITFHDFPSPSLVPNLKLVQLCSAGAEHIFKNPLYTDESMKHVAWCTASGVHGPQIGEHVYLTLLSLTHSYPQLLERQRMHKWVTRADFVAGFSKKYKPVDLTTFSLGILGYGAIGRQVGNIGRAMGMHPINVCTFSSRETKESRRVPDGTYIVPRTGDREGLVPDSWYCSRDEEEWKEFLAQTDVLVITVPLTKETQGMIGKNELSILGSKRRDDKENNIEHVGASYVVNISRGKVINQPELIAALEDGILTGASLDVTDPEPLPEDSPLWGMENVVITPHISGSVPEKVYLSRVTRLLGENLWNLERGDKPFNQVDRERGY